jgi:hypothetical protein
LYVSEFGFWWLKYLRFTNTAVQQQNWLLLYEASFFPLSLFSPSPEAVFVNLLRSSGIDSQRGGIDSSESIPGLLKRLQIKALISLVRNSEKIRAQLGRKETRTVGQSVNKF